MTGRTAVVRLSELRGRRVRLAAGLMTGTSMDGLDIAFCRIDRVGPRCDLLAFETAALPERLVRELRENDTGGLADAARWSRALGEAYARALLDASRRHGLTPDLIGSHGQTVFHAHGEATLQLGEPTPLAEAFGCPVVFDFRQGDIAAGGAGAPLVPYVDHKLVGPPDRAFLALNLGGIANLTAVPRRPCPHEAVIGFDCGPGNMVLDRLARLYTRDRLAADVDGAFAVRGRVSNYLFAHLSAHRFFAEAPPRSAGREQFGAAFTDALVEAAAPAVDQDWFDLFATATELSVHGVRESYDRFVRDRFPVEEVIVSGGGARNPEMMRRLRAVFAPVPVVTSDAYGWPADAKEAMAFAVLASERVDERPTNMPSVTGAKRRAFLGAVAEC